MSWPLACGSVCVVLCTVCTYSVRCALHYVHLQCAWCSALCAPTVCVVLCTVCTYSARGAMHCVHLQCAWCYALCAPTVWTLPTISSPVFTKASSSWEASRFSPSQSFRTYHAILKFIAVFIGAHHISTSRSSWIQSMPPHIISLMFFLILSCHLRLLLPNRSFPQVSPHEPCMRISNRCR